MGRWLEMNIVRRLNTNRIFSSLGIKLWLPVALGGVVALLALGYMVVRNYDREREVAAEQQRQAALVAADRLAA